jgi:hypothetical protein
LTPSNDITAPFGVEQRGCSNGPMAQRINDFVKTIEQVLDSPSPLIRRMVTSLGLPLPKKLLKFAYRTDEALSNIIYVLCDGSTWLLYIENKFKGATLLCSEASLAITAPSPLMLTANTQTYWQAVKVNYMFSSNYTVTVLSQSENGDVSALGKSPPFRIHACVLKPISIFATSHKPPQLSLQ